MKLLILGVIILFVFVIPIVYAETYAEIPYVFVQIIHKDYDGNLLAYLQSDRVTDANLDMINEMLEHESARGVDPIYQINGNIFQVITRESTLHFDSPLMYASSSLIQDVDDEQVIVLRLPHDGFRVLPGDTIKIIWIFSRSV
jgi:hypothetical protein